MQTTANLWEVLCRDLESQTKEAPGEKHRDAVSKFKDAACQVFNRSSRRISEALEIAGDVCKASGYFEDAVENFRDALERNLAGNAIPAAARVAAKLSLVLDEMGRNDEARNAYKEALALHEQAHDFSQHPMLASNLAGLEKRAGDFAACQEHYEQALEAAVKLHGEIHPSVALVCSNLAIALAESGDRVQAETLHMRALGIREQLFGAVHPEVAQSLANLAVVYHLNSEFDKARAYYEAALKTYGAFRPEDDPEILDLRAGLARLTGSCPNPAS